MIYHLQFDFGPTEIGRRLGRAASTISREFKRNTNPWCVYVDEAAQWRTDRRRQQIKRAAKRKHRGLLAYVTRALRAGWSPEAISERIQKEHQDDPAMRISHEAIYQWIYGDQQQGGTLYQHLRRKHRRRRRRRGNRRDRGQIKDRVGLEHRPVVVSERKRLGDWESDTLEGAKGRGCLGTHVERKSRYLVAHKMKDKKATTWTRRAAAACRSIPRRLCRTMTVDNGKEFADFKRLEGKPGVCIYFAHPYSAWERGTNENTNGLLRQHFPKGTDFSKVSRQEVAKAVRKLNNRPRKCLNYRTPREVFRKLLIVALGS